MGSACLAALLAPATALASVGQAKPLEATLTLEVHAGGLRSTPLETFLRVDAPTSDGDVAGVLANRLGTRTYTSSLQSLLLRLGLYAHDGPPLATRVAIDSDAPPDVAAAGGRATLLVSGTRDLASSLDPELRGLWEISREDSEHIRFCLPEAEVPAGADWTVEAYVDGLSVVSAAPPPTAWTRVTRFPARPNVQSPPDAPPLETAQGGVTHLVWQPAGEPDPPAVAACNATAAGGGKVSALAFEVRLTKSDRIVVASYDGLWAHLRLVLSYLVSMLSFAPLLYLLLRGSEARPERELSWRLWSSLAAALVIAAGGVLMWLLRPGSTQIHTDQVRPPLIAGVVAFAIALLVWHRRRPLVLAVLAAAVATTGLALWAQAAAGEDAFLRGGWITFAQGVVAAVVIALSTLTAVGLLTAGLTATVLGRHLPRARTLLSLGMCMAAGWLVLQSATGIYHVWRLRDDVATALTPLSKPAGWQAWAAGALVYFPYSFVGLALDLLPLVAFAGLLAALSSTARTATSTLFEAPSRQGPILALTFAAFVAGAQGVLYGWSVPISFAFAIVLALLLPRRKIERVVEGVDALNLGLEKPVALRSRAVLLRQATGAKEEEAAGGGKPGISLPPGASASGLALSLGPGRTWWENGRVAVRLGALLSLAPVAFYAYVLATQRLGHDLSLDNDGGAADVLRSSVHEILFWLAAALVLGILYPYLPGSVGALKGAALGVVYAASTGLEMWILPGGGDWAFRCLEVLLFLVVLGILLDAKTLVEHGASWRSLGKYYRVDEIRFSAAYVSAAIATLAAIVQQLNSGHAQNAIVQIIKSLPALIPPIH